MVPDNHATPVTTQHLLNWRLRTAAHTTNQSRRFAWNSSLPATSLTSTCSNSEYIPNKDPWPGFLTKGKSVLIVGFRFIRSIARDFVSMMMMMQLISQLIKTCGYEIGISIKSKFKLEIFNISQYVSFFKLKLKINFS